MSEWKEYRLGELASVIPGFAFKGKDFGVIGCRVVKIGDITPPIVDVTNCLRIPTDKINGLDKFKLQKGDFVLAMTGATLGKVGKYRSEETGYINQRVAKFENIKGISDKHFLYYLITSNHVTNEIINRGLGSAQPNISGKDIETINVVAPDLPTQTAIAEILSSLDDKIELNNKINQELENLAQTLFKQWFIDFEFPNENGEPYKSSGGEMVDSELGEIPKGWDVKRLSEIVKLTGGGTPKRSEDKYWNGDISWFSVQDVPSNSDVIVFETKEKITLQGLNNSSTKILPVGTTIITARGTVGKLAFVASPMAMNQSCYGVNGKDSIGPIFNYLNLFKSIDELKRNTHGAVFDTITTSTFETIKTSLPDSSTLNHFEMTLTPLFLIFEENVKENVELTTLRDTLLPKLISGELEVSKIQTTS